MLFKTYESLLPEIPFVFETNTLHTRWQRFREIRRLLPGHTASEWQMRARTKAPDYYLVIHQIFFEWWLPRRHHSGCWVPKVLLETCCPAFSGTSLPLSSGCFPFPAPESNPKSARATHHGIPEDLKKCLCMQPFPPRPWNACYGTCWFIATLPFKELPGLH